MDARPLFTTLIAQNSWVDAVESLILLSHSRNVSKINSNRLHKTSYTLAIQFSSNEQSRSVRVSTGQDGWHRPYVGPPAVRLLPGYWRQV